MKRAATLILVLATLFPSCSGLKLNWKNGYSGYAPIDRQIAEARRDVANQRRLKAEKEFDKHMRSINRSLDALDKINDALDDYLRSRRRTP